MSMKVFSKKKLVALFGLAGVGLLFGLMLAVVYVTQSPKAFKKFSAWKMGAEYLGTDGVVLQKKRNNCGPAALKMVFDHYGITSTLAEIEQHVGLTTKGSSMLALKEMAELRGLKAEGWRLTTEDFLKRPFPSLLFVHDDHYIVADSVDVNAIVFLRDPALGRLRMKSEKLVKIWNGETLVLQMRSVIE